MLFGVTGPIIGWLAIRYGLFATLAIQGAVLILVFTAMLIAFIRIPKKYFHVKTAVLERQ